MEDNDAHFSIYRKINLLIIKNNKTRNMSEDYLQINTLDFTPKIRATNDLGQKIKDCLGIIGIITLEDDSYLITITDSKLICTLERKEIYKVLDTYFIKFSDDSDLEEDNSDNNSTNLNNSQIKNNDTEIIEELKEIFKNGYYYSNNYDLANAFTSHNQIMLYFQKGKLLSDYDYLVDGNKNFLSNMKLIDKVIELKDIKYYFSNCIYGNIECFKCENQKIEIIIISRRYLWNYGIYNYRKGLSKYGGNSNQIETELILVYNENEVFSNIHLTSYLPIYFKEKKNKTLIEDANKAFIKYIKTLIEEYNLIFFFALKTENDEKYVKRMKSMLLKNKSSLGSRWKFYCLNSNENSIKKLFREMKSKTDLIEFAGYNIIVKKKFDKDITQLGIFSLVSIDNKLINQNEFFLIYDTIYHFLLKLNERNKIPIFLDENIDTDLFEDNEDEQNKINDDSTQFIENLKNILKKRMDELEKQYYTNNYDDEKNKHFQRIYELLFGKNTKFSPLKNNLNYLKEEYSDLNNLKIFVGSWNVACTDPNKDLNLDSWLLPKDPNLIPDIYFIGFQEVVELTASNVIMIKEEKQKQILSQWDNKINSSINKIGKYTKLVDMNLVGINFYCYVLEEKSSNIKNLSQKIVKTGLGGTTGNKGSCCINFDYENTCFSVACSHLAAGGSKNKQRLKELDYILEMKLDSFFNKEEFEKKLNEIFYFDNMEYNADDDESKIVSQTQYHTNDNPNAIDLNDDSISFKNSDIWIIFGDLNFRVDMEYEEFSEYVKKGNWNKLIDYDQFFKFKLASIEYMKCIQEDEIKFPPTYKYIVNSNEYDYKPKENKKKDKNKPQGSGKKRNPSWCDRVFYKKNAYVTKNGQKIITGVEYNNVLNDNFITSDHRPVYQIFDVIIFKENPQKKEAIEKEILTNEKLRVNNKYLKKKIYDY
jgi:hypothetical protein